MEASGSPVYLRNTPVPIGIHVLKAPTLIEPRHRRGLDRTDLILCVVGSAGTDELYNEVALAIVCECGATTYPSQ